MYVTIPSSHFVFSKASESVYIRELDSRLSKLRGRGVLNVGSRKGESIT
jgi:hypothetical protein